jgi:hypothetical protein
MSETRGSRGEVFLDARGNGRALRLTWHHEADVVVLSLWREDMCAGTFRLATADVNAFVDALVDGIRDEVDVSADPHGPDAPPVQRPAVEPPETGEVQAATEPAAPEAARVPFSEWAFDPDARRATAS